MYDKIATIYGICINPINENMVLSDWQCLGFFHFLLIWQKLSPCSFCIIKLHIVLHKIWQIKWKTIIKLFFSLIIPRHDMVKNRWEKNMVWISLLMTKKLVKIILSGVTIVNYLQYFEIKVKQPFYDEKKSLNNYILKSKSCFYDKTDS